jgi:hypothetical protein
MNNECLDVDNESRLCEFPSRSVKYCCQRSYTRFDSPRSLGLEGEVNSILDMFENRTWNA